MLSFVQGQDTDQNKGRFMIQCSALCNLHGKVLTIPRLKMVLIIAQMPFGSLAADPKDVGASNELVPPTDGFLSPRY